LLEKKVQLLQTDNGLYAMRVRPVIVACSTAPPAQAIAINVLSDGCSLADGSVSPGETWVIVRTACVYRKLKRAQSI
jgi:hypothetical protein